MHGCVSSFKIQSPSQPQFPHFLAKPQGLFSKAPHGKKRRQDNVLRVELCENPNLFQKIRNGRQSNRILGFLHFHGQKAATADVARTSISMALPSGR